ncbi:hypothetical protein niasHT_003523 [Heterodera trifolii]|uniref:F-box domain-containing protein n=1 Tax=Heterodera trifolii TaxID=157864 RepID=A0ABD2M2H9_9BILA
MCSTNSEANEADVKIAEQLMEMDISEKNVSSPASAAEKDYIGMVLPYEILTKITTFLGNGHDSLEALSFTSKRMANRIKPILMEKRRKLFDAFIAFVNSSVQCLSANFLDECVLLLSKSEKYLKRVLRTNEHLSLRSHNLPMRRLSFVLLGVGDSICDENRFSLEARAHQLLAIARLHCYKFSNFYANCFPHLLSKFGRENGLGEQSCTKLEQALAYSLFKDFMRKYQILSKFTDVIWPQGMSDEAKKQMAKDYGEKNSATAKNPCSKPRRMGRMFEMRVYGRVGNPHTAKPRREYTWRYRPYKAHYDYDDYYSDGSVDFYY